MIRIAEASVCMTYVPKSEAEISESCPACDGQGQGCDCQPRGTSYSPTSKIGRLSGVFFVESQIFLKLRRTG